MASDMATEITDIERDEGVSVGIRLTVKAVAVAVCLAALTGGCSSVPDEVNPVEWYKGVEELVVGEDEDAEQANADGVYQAPETTPGADQPFPTLGDVPERPVTSSAGERRALAEGLVADRTGRAYAEQVPLQGAPEQALRTTPSTLPEVSRPPSPPDLDLSSDATSTASAAAGSVAAAGQEAQRQTQAATSRAQAMVAATAGTAADPMSTASPGGEVPQVSAPPTAQPPTLPSAPALPPAATAMPDSVPPPPPPYGQVPSASAPPPTVIAGTAGGDRRTAGVLQTFERNLRAPVPQDLTATLPPANSLPTRASEPITGIVISSTGVETLEGDRPAAARGFPPGPVLPPGPGGPRAAFGGGQFAGIAPGGTSAGGFATVSASVPPGSIRVATIRFGNGSSKLDQSDRKILGEVRSLHRNRGGTVRVIGHASSRTRNMDLTRHKMANYRVSAARADTVARALVRMGIPQSQIVVAAVSDDDPLYYEIMPSGEAGNRRAEVYIDY